MPHPTAQDHAEIGALFASIPDARTMAAFLCEILTPSERVSVAMRWKLLKMLHRQVPQRVIAEELGVSLCKITRGSRILKDQSSVSRRLLENQ